MGRTQYLYQWLHEEWGFTLRDEIWDEKSVRDASASERWFLTRRVACLGCCEPKSDDEVGCRDPSSRTVFASCYLWKHWSHNADVKKFNDVFVRNAAISLNERKFVGF